MEQTISDPTDKSTYSATIAEMSELRLKLKTRMTYNLMIEKDGYLFDTHVQQFVLYFTVQNLDESSENYGEFIWIGLVPFDNRYDFTPGISLADDWEEGTSALMYNMNYADYADVSVNSGNWSSVDADVLPHVKEAIAFAKEHGYVNSGDLSKYRIGAMNIDYETTGLFITTIQVGELQLTQYK